jgi:hypothetical protein
MSCICNQPKQEPDFPCPCDRFVHPLPLNIGAGLSDLPRQMAGFPEFRRAMLFEVRNHEPLNQWRARQPDDLGIMLLEMWAYVCDALSFYDKVIAQEAYLRTAHLRPSLRRLIALLGYLPRPSVASIVYLSALAEGRQLVKLPEGTAFRSGGFDDHPTQVFELDGSVVIHPLTNRWNLKAPQPGLTETANPSSLLVLPRLEPKTASPLLLVDVVNASNTQGLWLAAAETYSGTDGKTYRKLLLAQPSDLPTQYPLTRLQLFQPAQTAALWSIKLPKTPPTMASVEANSTIVLNGLQQAIKAGDNILIVRMTEVRWYRITKVDQETRLQSAGNPVVINGSTFDLPGISVPVTKLTLDKDINHSSRKKAGAANWTEAESPELVVHFAMQPAGTITDDPKTSLSSSDPLQLEGRTEKPLEDYQPRLFQLIDKNLQGVQTSGLMNFATSELKLDQGEDWNKVLTVPVQAFGNVIKATRGEQVPHEILGSGDASIPNQVFRLKKKPLTYLPAPTVANDSGVQSSLRVYVNGIRWTEVPGFYNKKPEEEIYIVRQNDEEETLVMFGDGLRGKRPPTGADNIIATYRFGAGAAAPPAGSVNQIAKSIKGLQSVNNALPASGGADAEGVEGIRRYAPRSVLLLGRAVSLPDMEAVAASVAGVRAVQVEWRWHGSRQSPVAQVWYIGEVGMEVLLRQRLRSLTDPTTPIAVEQAEAVPTGLKLDIQIDPRFLWTSVLNELRTRLTNPENGLLAPAGLGIGKPLFRSQIFAAAAAVPGVLAVRNILWNNAPFPVFAKTPRAGKYFDFEKGGLELNGFN